MRRVAVTVLVLALIGGTATAFAITEALKLEPSPVSSRRLEEVFSPTCDCPARAAKFLLQLRRSDRLDLDIVARGELVRTLARDLPRETGRVRVRWNGRNDAGEIVPDGVYHLRVHLREADRTVDIPRRIRVDTEGPTLELLAASPLVFSPDGDGRRDSLRIHYRTSDESSLIGFLAGREVLSGRLAEAGEGELVWDGGLSEGRVKPGAHILFLRARDPAGNLSAPVKVEARVRYMELSRRAIRVRRGGKLRFRVEADARGFSWILRRAGGEVVRADARAEPGVVSTRLPNRIRPGRYILEVAANGHRDRALVRVLRRRG